MAKAFVQTTESWGNVSPASTMRIWTDDAGRLAGERAPDDQLPKDLHRLIRRAKAIGVELSLRNDARHISLLWVSRGRNHRQPAAPKGSGAIMIWALCDFADRQRRSIWLEVVDGPKLVRYYRQFGFKVSRDYGNREDYEMIRDPR